MQQVLKILLLEDNPQDAEMIQRLLIQEKVSCECRWAMNKKTFLLALEEFVPDLIISDHSLPQFNSSKALEIAREKFPGIPFIMVTGTVSEEFAANIMKQGADDYMLKDRMARLPAAINNTLHQRKIELEKAEAIRHLILSEEKYRTIFLQSPLPIWIYDLDTLAFLDVNDAAIRHYGYSREEFLQLTIRDIRPPETLNDFLEDIRKIKDGEDRRQGLWQHVKKNGEILVAETTAHSLNFNNRKARMVIVNDVTAKLKAQDALQQSEENLKAIFDNTSEAFILLDEEGIIKAFNNRAEKSVIINSDLSLETAKSIFDYVTDDRKQFFQEVISKVLKGEIISYDRSYYQQDGSLSWINFSYNPVWNNGIINGICITGIDITERKKSEAELYRLEQEKLKNKMEEQKKITIAMLTAQEKERSAIGIELHDNVNQILVGTNLVLSMVKNSPDKYQELANTAMANIKEAIEENRKIAHVFVAPDLQTETLVDLLEKLADKMLKPAGIKTNISLNQFKDDLLTDDRKINIYRIAQEQCTNVIKYARATEVSILLKMNDDAFSMILSDNGAGMDTTTKATGIGLRNINDRLGLFNGTSNIVSSLGNGFSLEIMIPL